MEKWYFRNKCNGILNILSTNGTAIDIDGVNKVDIKNSNINIINGKNIGINLNLSMQNNTDLKKRVDELKYNKIVDIMKLSPEVTETLLETKLSVYLKDALDSVFKQTEFGSFENFYKDLITNPTYKEDPATAELISKLDPDGDPVFELLKVSGGLEQYGLDINKFYDYTMEDYLIAGILTEMDCSSVNELYDKLAEEGEVVKIMIILFRKINLI